MMRRTTFEWTREGQQVSVRKGAHSDFLKHGIVTRADALEGKYTVMFDNGTFLRYWWSEECFVEANDN